MLIFRKMEMIVVALLTIALAHLTLGVILWLRVRKLYSYPGLLGYPVIGNLYYFYRTLFLGSAESLRAYLNQVSIQYGKDGICFHYVYGFKKVVIVSSPQVIKQIGYNPNLKDKSYYGYQCFKPYLNGPFGRPYSDDLWKIKKKEYNCLLKKSKIENNFYNIFLKYANKKVELMLASRHALDIVTTSAAVIQSVTMEALLGLEGSTACHPDIIHIMKSLKEIGSFVIANPRIGKIILLLMRPIDEIFIRKLGTIRRELLREIYKNMNYSNLSLTSGNTELFHPIWMYIVTRIKKNEKFDKKVLSELQEVFVTASHTTATVLAASITMLAVLPEIQERAWKEQYEIFGNDTREPSLDDLEQMMFLERFINESLRYCASPIIEKQVTGDVEVDGIIIPKGAIVLYLMDFIRQDPNYWKDPEVFDPDRFLEEKNLQNTFAPFGIGIRSCPGSTFAIILLKIILSKVLRRTQVSTLKKDLKFEDLKFEAHVLMELKNPPLLQVKERF